MDSLRHRLGNLFWSLQIGLQTWQQSKKLAQTQTRFHITEQKLPKFKLFWNVYLILPECKFNLTRKRTESQKLSIIT